MKAGAANYSAIMSSNVLNWNDISFNQTDMVYWSDYRPKNPTTSLIGTYNSISSWNRLFKHFPQNSIFGPGGVNTLTVTQSRFLGDCYFIAAIVSLA